MKNPVIVAGGLDPSGGAGLSVDIKTASFFHALPLPVITAVTYQNSTEFSGYDAVDTMQVEKQLNSILDSYNVKYAKIGMSGSASNLYKLLTVLSSRGIKIVLDPVIKPTAGGEVLTSSMLTVLKENLHKVYLLTPNLYEAKTITEATTNDIRELGSYFKNFRQTAVLIKGGHSSGDSSDFLFEEDNVTVFQGDRIDTKNLRGTGCTLSTAITAVLASGILLSDACKIAKQYVTSTMNHNYEIGKPPYPLNHLLI
jgi:hydroxymethylpyrimidine/phosphomethylpyrimidine kinase